MKKYISALIISVVTTLSVWGVNQFTKADLSFYPTRGMVYINVWEEWCQPCVKELPELKKLSDKYLGVRTYLVSDTKNQDKAKALLKALKIEGFREIYSDEKTEELKSLFSQQESQGVPKHIIIKDGKVIYKKVGSGPDILKELEEHFQKYDGVAVVTKDDEGNKCLVLK